MKLAVIGALLVCTLAPIVAFAAGRLAIVNRWALYAASAPGRSYHLFLEPFPDAYTCNRAEAEIHRTGGRAYCTGHLAISFDPNGDTRLFWEFASPANVWLRKCD